jgi:hypothetical protein
MPLAGDPVYATDVARARPTTYYKTASGTLPAGSTAATVPGCVQPFDTATDGATCDMRWFVQCASTAAMGSQTACRAVITGPTASSSPVYSVFRSQAANEADNPGQEWVQTLGVAGTYTVTLQATTPVGGTTNVYSSLTVVVTEAPQ